jgi:hypothetical protein
MTPDLMPKDAQGNVKMIGPNGERETYSPAKVANMMQMGYRLPTAQELGAGSPSGPSGGASPQITPPAPTMPAQMPTSTPVAQPPDPQDVLTPALTRMGVPSSVISTLKGMAKAGGKMAVSTASMLGARPTDVERQSTQYSNNTEKYAGMATDAALALAPGGVATRVGKLAEGAPAAVSMVGDLATQAA